MDLIGKNVGNYRVTAKIGEGGMGSVYLGEHPMIGKKVAIKTLHAELSNKDDIVARFFNEARAVNDIGHPNIVDIVDFGTLPDEDTGKDIVYFIMEFLDGEGLNDRLKRAGVSPEEAVHVLRQCASALSASHHKHIVHRDLKPDNIYLIRRGGDANYVKLLDFGIAKLTGGGTGSQNRTRTGLVIGTPAYMSPEQCEGKGDVDWRSDVYSLGVVFYEMLTGRVPFLGEGFGEVLVAHITQAPPPPSQIRPEVPPALEAIVLRMIEKDKARRFQSMEEVTAALDDPEAHLAQLGATSSVLQRSSAGTEIMSAVGPGGGHTTGAVARVTSSQLAQSPTTLSGAASEVSASTPPPASRGPAPRIALVAVALVAVGAGGWFFLHGGRSAPAAAPAATAAARTTSAAVVARPTPPPAVPALPATVKISIDSTPRGASIVRAGVVKPLGVTPFTMSLPRGSEDFDILLKADGYQDQKLTVHTARDQRLVAALAELPRTAAPPPPAAARHEAHARSSHHKLHDRDDVLVPSF